MSLNLIALNKRSKHFLNQNEVRRLAASEGGAGGLTQGIGYKELLPLLSPPENPEAYEALVRECSETLVIATKQYATKQKRWIKNNFVAAKKWPVYLLDTSDVSKWDQLVLHPAQDLVRRWFSGAAFDSSHPLSAATSAASIPLIRKKSGSNERAIVAER